MIASLKSAARSIILTTLGSAANVKSATYFLNGHYVAQQNLPIEQQLAIFEKQVRKLSAEFELVTPETALQNLHQSARKLLCFTFDDGFTENINVMAPVAEAFNTRCVFFVNPDFVGLPQTETMEVLEKKYLLNFPKTFMTEREVRTLADRGHTIGSHTASHMRLTIEDDTVLDDELVRCKSDIEKITGKPCNTFAHPFGGMKELSEKALEKAQSVYDHVFASTVSNHLFEGDGTVINRRHFEGNWPVSHIKYFLARRS